MKTPRIRTLKRLKNGLDPNLSSRHQIAFHMIALMYIIFIEKEFLWSPFDCVEFGFGHKFY
jgi:hypothetical protein